MSQNIDIFGQENNPNNPEIHWVDMPEFVQDKKQEHKKITIRFRNESDYQCFADLISQKLTIDSKSIWFPKLNRGKENPYI